MIIKTRNKVVMASLFLVFSFYTTLCTRSSHKEITQVNLMVNYPVSIANNEKLTFFELKDTISIFYCKDFIIYKLKPKRDLQTNLNVKFTEPFFAFKKENKEGWYFNDYKSLNNPSRLPVDSILSREAFGKLNLDIDFNNQFLKVISQYEGNESIEKYYYKNKTGDMVDSLYYYYDRSFVNKDFSLSKFLDSTKKSKLYKVRLIYNESFSDIHKLTLPKREYSFEIRQIPFSGNTTILQLLNKIENLGR